ncbi:MAG: hypothetical protein Q4B80_00985 [Aerococcaceae bacterium]|nr:hypothetical protein [Aerococcaceae bacterium]
MSRSNLYVHYDSVTNHVMTRGINLVSEDFEPHYLPNHIILAEAPAEIGRYDVKTNFKILRGKNEVLHYLELCYQNKVRMSNWIDFERVELMHQLTPNEIAELLYLFHSSFVLRSAFFYKLQNNYVFLTLPNGLNKTYYRHVAHFYPRFQRVVNEQMDALVNETKSHFFAKKEQVPSLPLSFVEKIAPLFASGLKVNFAQAYSDKKTWFIPLMVIEDELTLLTQGQSLSESVGALSYNVATQEWRLALDLEDWRNES